MTAGVGPRLAQPKEPPAKSEKASASTKKAPLDINSASEDDLKKGRASCDKIKDEVVTLSSASQAARCTTRTDYASGETLPREPAL